MFEFEAYKVLKTKEFTVVNDCFQNEYNEKIGHYGQTLVIFAIVCVISAYHLFEKRSDRYRMQIVNESTDINLF